MLLEVYVTHPLAIVPSGMNARHREVRNGSLADARVKMLAYENSATLEGNATRDVKGMIQCESLVDGLYGV